MIDCKTLSDITGKPVSEIESIYNSWLIKKKKKKGMIVADLNLLSQLSGLSTASISYFMNNKKGSISAEKSKKLEKIIECVNYTPSKAAKRLRSLEKKSIAFVSPLSNSPSPEFYIEILRGVKEEAKKYGYYVDIFDVEEKEEEKFFNNLPFLGMVDGVITASLNFSDEMLEPLANYNIPIVNIYSWNKPNRKPVINSLIPNTEVFEELLDHLFLDCGFSNPTLISLHPKNHIVRKRKIELFEKCLSKHGIAFERQRNIMFIQKHSIMEAQKVYPKIFKRNSKTDVIVCLSDVVATVICRELSKEHKHIAVTGHDNSDISKLYNLTTIDQRMKETGRIAFEKLYYGIQYILKNNEFPEYDETNIQFDFIKRESTLLYMTAAKE